jgi:hypothetical protein
MWTHGQACKRSEFVPQLFFLFFAVLFFPALSPAVYLSERKDCVHLAHKRRVFSEPSHSFVKRLLKRLLREGTVALGCFHMRILAFSFPLYNNLTVGYIRSMKKASEAAKELAKRSVAARQLKWGKDGFRERMRAWGALGGRPRTKKGNSDAN